MADKIKVSTSAKKVISRINQTAAKIYEDAVNVKNETWFPKQDQTKPVNPTILKSTIATEADNITKQLQSNLSEEDLEVVKQATAELLDGYGTNYEKIYNNNGYRFGFTTDYKYDTDPYVQEIGSSRVGNLTVPTYAAFMDGRRLDKNISAYAATNNTYSMCDIVCTIDIASNSGEHVVTTLGKLQTLSYSIYQQKQPVRCLGNMNAKDYVYGQRTIAGSLVFAVFNRHWLVDIYDELVNKGMMKNWHYVADEMPPFDVTISFANEYGYDSKMAIYGVRLMTEGQVMSINDIYIENTYQFVATDIEYMDALNAWQSTDKIGRRWTNTKTASIIASNAGNPSGESGTGNVKMKGEDVDKKQEGSGTDNKVIFTGSILIISEADLKESSEADMLTKLQKAYESQKEAFQNALNQATKEGNTEQIKEYKEVLQKLSKEYETQRKTIQDYYAKQKVDKAKAS